MDHVLVKFVSSVPEHQLEDPARRGEAAANTERHPDGNSSVAASFLGLLDIDKLAERQEAFVLLRDSNTAFGRPARRLHTF